MANPPDLQQACLAPPCATLLAAVRQFNAGDYFVCHETLEELWLNRDDPLRDLYQGILQLAVGLLHLQKGNLNGARALLGRGIELVAPVAPVAPVCRGIDIADLQRQAARVLRNLERQETKGALPHAGERPQIRLVASDA